jgi:hypothetical protein
MSSIEWNGNGTDNTLPFSAEVLLLILVGCHPRMYCSLWLIVLALLWKFPIAPPGAPTSTTMRETSSRERGNCGRQMTGNFADNGNFHNILGIFYMPQICNMGLTALLRIFLPWKIRRLWLGLNPRTWVPEASMLPHDHQSRVSAEVKNLWSNTSVQHTLLCVGTLLSTGTTVHF